MPSLTTKLATSTTRLFGVIAVTGGVAFLASAVAIGAPAGRTAAIFAKCAAVVTSRPLPRTGGALPISFALIGLVLLGLGASLVLKSRRGAAAFFLVAALTGSFFTGPTAHAAPTGTDPCTSIIGDRVWFDANSDGIQDATEVGARGVRVRLRDADGNDVLVTTTAADGSYLFDGLPAGTYNVVFPATVNDGPLTTPGIGTNVVMPGTRPIATSTPAMGLHQLRRLPRRQNRLPRPRRHRNQLPLRLPPRRLSPP